MELIPRPQYIEKIAGLINRGMMLILVGQRRVGKSKVLELFREWLNRNRPGANIVYINKEYQAFRDIVTAEQLYDYAAAQMPEGAENYLLIDEVQDIENYENALRSFHAEDRCQVIATGSNAYIFSSELGTHLSGRYIEIKIYNLSYTEFLRFHSMEDSDDAVMIYLRLGGLPGLLAFRPDEQSQITDYLEGVYNTILVKDIVRREKVRNVTQLENIIRFVADNIGKPISVTKIVRYMTSKGEKISDETVSNYLKYLRDAFLAVPIGRFDIHGKLLLESNNKHYFSDHGIRNYLCGSDIRGSIEKIMENVVWNHLRRQGLDVTVGILRAGEIDFVATKADKRMYIQVTYLLASDETVKREFGNLAAIKDNYPKYVVSLDPVSGGFSEYPGIEHISLRNFLKMDF
ncbi:ATP-binding protein [uncultured Duncaniella sp.]|uniref:ATP-binding protein n=1 Tax=uncultured Duncaniella sp. TaxID=2768039 RepID=UPI00272CA188|nr:ATP-binding protein [uncultured Duncaniella sp.]